MAYFPDIAIFEPSPHKRRQQAAQTFITGDRNAPEEYCRERLKEIRRNARGNHDEYRRRLRESLENLSGTTVTSAKDVPEAIAVIKEIAGDTRLVSINKSSIVMNELRPALRDAGFTAYLRYFGEFEHFGKETFDAAFHDCWSLPGFTEKGLGGSWDIREHTEYLRSSPRRDYIALLGVNAAAAADGSVYFLQHMSNISKDLEQARKVILIVGIDKIVGDRDAATIHTRSMGLLGLESMFLDLVPGAIERYDFEALPPPAGDEVPSFHVILFDNGRSVFPEGGYEDLFLCIDCRACARQCPVGQHMGRETGMLYSPKNYLLAFLQHKLPSVEGCLHCGRCRAECPLDIDLPTLFWKAQSDYYGLHGRTWKKRMLDNPELLARLGAVTAPLSSWVSRLSLSRYFMEWCVGIDRHSALPAFHRITVRKQPPRGGRG